MKTRYWMPAGLALALTALSANPKEAKAPPGLSAAQACHALDGKAIGGAARLQGTMVASQGSLPVYCRISGLIAPKLNFELRIPDRWNGKLYYQGGGGFNGAVNPLDTYVPSGAALSHGYIVVASDSGHQARVSDAAWAREDPQAMQLWGSLSVPTVMSAALAITRSAYGRPPARSYFEGCSNGGREGMMAMERAPNLFDGVIVRAPAYNVTGVFGHWITSAKALAAPGAALSNAKVATLAKAVRKRCDTLDGLADGLVSNSRACAAAFDVAALRCSAGADTGDDCLSDAQLTAVRTVLSPASFGPGSGAYHDAARPLTGNEDDPQAWPLWVTGDGDVRKSLTFAFADSAIKAFIARDPNVQSLAYPAYDQDLDTLFYFAAIADATSPDIRPFTSRGGKVIFWHGGNDGAFSVNSTADYVGKVTSVPGGETSAEASVRFYVAPGVNHCSGGPGADKSDLLAALDAWVTEDRAPGVLRATKLDAAGAVQFERPLCPYPQHPRYTGPANDPAAEKSASNYVCAAP